MFMLTAIEEDGAYAIVEEDGEKTLYFFQDQDDAFRYVILLGSRWTPRDGSCRNRSCTCN